LSVINPEVKKCLPGRREALFPNTFLPSPFQSGSSTVSSDAVDPPEADTGYLPYPPPGGLRYNSSRESGKYLITLTRHRSMLRL